MTASPMDRDATLTDFTRARDELLQAYEPVPDAALRYLPEGDDYALGGLIVHVANVIEHYLEVLQQIKAANFGAINAVDGSGETPQMLEALKHGFEGAQKHLFVERMNTGHGAFAAEVLSIPGDQWDRTAPVTFSSGSEPSATGAREILGWLTGHYREHVDQVAKMLAEWQALQK